MKILVTGASGYIGSKIVDVLIEQGQEVYAADVRFEGLNPKAKKITEPIFSGKETIFQDMGEPDACIHLAWRDGFVHASDTHMLDLPMHYLFVKNMMAGGLKHFIGMGSMHEIGYFEGAVDENTPTNPQSLYGIAKNSLRQATSILAQKYGTKYSWIRGYYILGDDRHNHSIFTKLLEMDEKGEKTFPFNSGKNKYDFLDVNELARQIAYVSMQDKICGVVNCCSGVPMSLGEKVESFIQENGLSIKLEYGKFPDRPYDSPAIWGDNSKIQQILKNRQ
jgi:nucleoside-diphosphate-sugar epimerase